MNKRVIKWYFMPYAHVQTNNFVFESNELLIHWRVMSTSLLWQFKAIDILVISATYYESMNPRRILCTWFDISSEIRKRMLMNSNFSAIAIFLIATISFINFIGHNRVRMPNARIDETLLNTFITKWAP